MQYDDLMALPKWARDDLDVMLDKLSKHHSEFNFRIENDGGVLGSITVTALSSLIEKSYPFIDGGEWITPFEDDLRSGMPFGRRLENRIQFDPNR